MSCRDALFQFYADTRAETSWSCSARRGGDSDFEERETCDQCRCNSSEHLQWMEFSTADATEIETQDNSHAIVDGR